MPFSQKQINRILSVGDKPLVAPGRLDHHLALRVTESFIRRKLYSLEDRAVVDAYRQYADTYRQLRTDAYTLADRYGVDTLAPSRAAFAWRDSLLDVAFTRLPLLGQTVARSSFEYATQAYYGAYYGRLWQLDTATRPDVRIKTPTPNLGAAADRVLNPRLTEAMSNDDLYRLLGREWQQTYAGEMDALLVTMRRSLNASMSAGGGIRDAMRKLADDMGVVTDRRRTGVPDVRANFNRIQVITRTYTLDAANSGTLESYRANADMLSGVEWLAANDGRVCRDCMSLNGTVWALNDPDLRKPPADSHPNCRCTLIAVINPQYLLPPLDPPALTFTEWAEALGVAWMLRDFFSVKKLDSSLIGEFGEYEVEGI